MFNYITLCIAFKSDVQSNELNSTELLTDVGEEIPERRLLQRSS